jgi:hypothetical protein
MYEKNYAVEKKNLTKNLKIGLKLQKNLDTKKFGLVKNCAYKNLNPAKKKVVLLAKKKYILYR